MTRSWSKSLLLWTLLVGALLVIGCTPGGGGGGDKAYIVSYVYLDGELYDGRYGPMEVTLTHSGTAKTVDLLENPFTFTDLPVAFASVKVQLVIPQGGGVLAIREAVGRTLRAGENVFQFTGLKTN